MNDHELAEKLVAPRMLDAVNKTGKLLLQVSAGRLEQRAGLVRLINTVFEFHYYRDRMNAVTHLDDVRFSPLTVMLAEALRDDDTDAPLNYAAINEVISVWDADRLPEGLTTTSPVS